ncbi:MAG: MFS transporter [Halobacteriota archaeon]|nr:MFS transporter [Halobacteriota archaeon]
MEKDQKEAKKTVRTFAFVSFLNDFGSDMIYPIWPLFVTTVLGANMAALGLIDGLGEAIVSISQALSGYTSDRIRRRKVFIWTGYLFGSLSRVGYGLSVVWQHFLLFKILDRAGKIRGAPRDAIIADVSTKENRCENFGIMRMMDHLGATCGVIICIIILFLFVGMPDISQMVTLSEDHIPSIPDYLYRNIFFLAAIPSLIGVFLILVLVKESKTEGIKIYEGLSLGDLDKNFKIFILLSSVFALGSFSYSFLLIYAKEFGFQMTFVPVLYLIFTVFASLSSLPFGRLSDRVGRKQVLMLSYIFWGLVCASFIFISHYLLVIVTFVLYGLHKGALEPVQKTFVSELAPEDFRASVLGGYQMVIGLCALPASVVAGLLWDKIGIFMPFYFSLALTVISIVMLGFIEEK